MVCLTGFMGSGKSTVGRMLAAQLAWHFVDLDSDIERHTGLPIAQIFEQKGEPVFRDIEHDCLTRVLGWASERDARVVACRFTGRRIIASRVAANPFA